MNSAHRDKNDINTENDPARCVEYGSELSRSMK